MGDIMTKNEKRQSFMLNVMNLPGIEKAIGLAIYNQGIEVIKAEGLEDKLVKWNNVKIVNE
jgi:hypothetical protein